MRFKLSFVKSILTKIISKFVNVILLAVLTITSSFSKAFGSPWKDAKTLGTITPIMATAAIAIIITGFKVISYSHSIILVNQVD